MKDVGQKDREPRKAETRKQVEAAGAIGSGKPEGSIKAGAESLANGSRETAVNSDRKT